jgi:hypothetical protein
MAASSIDELFETFPNCSLSKMPSTEQRISQAVEWTNEHLPAQQEDHGGEPARRRTVAEVQAAIARPRHDAAIKRVYQATFAGETDAQRYNCEQCKQCKAQFEAARLRFTSKCRKMQWLPRLPIKLCFRHVPEMNGSTTSREVWNLQSIMSWIDLVMVLVTITSKSSCTEQPDSSTLCTQKLS